MRLDKFLAEASVGTRKNVREYIKEGLVKVNGKVTREPSLNINEKVDSIKYNNNVIEYKGKVYYMFHKPQGCITARKDINTKTVLDFFEDTDMDGIFHVGRLDKDTEGLLLFTNDGEFEHHLMCPEKHVDKKYFFIALGSLSEEDVNKIENGLYIGQGEKITKPAKLEIIKYGEFEEFEEMNIRDFYKAKTDRYKQPVISGHLTISEGRKHQVKRMLKAVGCYVIYLKRVAIGNLILDETLEKGKYRALTEHEVEKLFKQ